MNLPLASFLYHGYKNFMLVTCSFLPLLGWQPEKHGIGEGNIKWSFSTRKPKTRVLVKWIRWVASQVSGFLTIKWYLFNYVLDYYGTDSSNPINCLGTSGVFGVSHVLSMCKKVNLLFWHDLLHLTLAVPTLTMSFFSTCEEIKQWNILFVLL